MCVCLLFCVFFLRVFFCVFFVFFCVRFSVCFFVCVNVCVCVCLFCVRVNGSVFISLAVKFGLDLLTYTHIAKTLQICMTSYCVWSTVFLGVTKLQ